MSVQACATMLLVCVCESVCVGVRVCICTCKSMCMSVRESVSTCVSVCLRECAHEILHVCVCESLCVCVWWWCYPRHSPVHTLCPVASFLTSLLAVLPSSLRPCVLASVAVLGVCRVCPPTAVRTESSVFKMQTRRLFSCSIPAAINASSSFQTYHVCLELYMCAMQAPSG